ncbi:hypothetical protein GCM10009799_31300 [Nocardiopsis rhodophaea]|uniref:Uncharacterized protein n=1 Tax=Nocardiopsis rhodophaea TaxID=280238 RepID=A0ABN2T974_9ACTN
MKTMGMRDRALEALNSERGVKFAIELMYELTIASRCSRAEADGDYKTLCRQLTGYLELQHLLTGLIKRSGKKSGPLDVDVDFLEILRNCANNYSVEDGLFVSIYSTLEHLE